MRKMFDVWVEMSRQGPGVPAALWVIWIQSRSPSRYHRPEILDGVAVRPLASGVGHNSAEFGVWLKYAYRTARGWNALCLAAELFELRRDTPPYLLADAAWEAGEHHLAAELQELFNCGPSASSRHPVAAVPHPPPAEEWTGEKGYIVV